MIKKAIISVVLASSLGWTVDAEACANRRPLLRAVAKTLRAPLAVGRRIRARRARRYARRAARHEAMHQHMQHGKAMHGMH